MVIQADDERLLETVIVNLGTDANGPWARPRQAVALQRESGGDKVRFQSRYPFEVAFKGETPFEWASAEGEAENGLHVAYGTVQPNTLGPGVPEKWFGYDLTVDGVTIDPDVVVKKDPRDT